MQEMLVDTCRPLAEFSPQSIRDFNEWIFNEWIYNFE